MNITINQQKLKKVISATERVISKSLTLPILHNLVIKTEQGRVKIYSTNLEIGITGWLSAKIEEEGEIALPAKIFSDFVNNLHEEKISIFTKENIIYVNTDQYKAKIIGFSSKEFPLVPKPKETAFLSLNASTLVKLINSVIDSVSLSEARPELSGIFLSFLPQSITSAATDSFRLAEQVIWESGKKECSVIIPRSTAQEIMRIFGGEEESVAITLSENQIFFKGEDLEIVSRLIDGHYPDYKKVIPEKSSHRVLLSVQEMEKSIKLASIFSSNVSSDIKLQGDKNGLKILARNPDKGEVSLSIPAQGEGNNFEITVNFRYLLDGLKIMPTENVIFEFTGEGSPLVLKPEAQKDLTYLIMPLRS